MNAETYFHQLDQIREISTLPIILTRVNQMLQDYNISVRKISKVIESDQAITSKILKLVNSAFYGFRSKISNIPHAIMILGFNNVRNAVISISTFNLFSGKEWQGFEGDSFWKHSVGVAITCKYLSEKTRLMAPNDAFLAGLLHDIGKVILAQYFKEDFRKIWTTMAEKGLSFYEAEKGLPLHHGQIGGYLARKWQFPLHLADAIQYHHEIGEKTSDQHLLPMVHLADCIVNHRSDNWEAEAGDLFVDLGILKVLKFQRETVPEWFPGLSEEIESACQFFLQEG